MNQNPKYAQSVNKLKPREHKVQSSFMLMKPADFFFQNLEWIQD